MHVLNCTCYFLLLAIKIHCAFLLHEKLLETYGDRIHHCLEQNFIHFHMTNLCSRKIALSVLRTFVTSQHEKIVNISFRTVIFI